MLTNREGGCFDGLLCSCVELKYSDHFMASSILEFVDALSPFWCNQQPWTLVDHCLKKGNVLSKALIGLQ